VCLYANRTASNNFRESDWGPNNEKTFYKALIIRNQKLISPFYPMQYLPGYCYSNIIDEPYFAPEKESLEIDRGIHVSTIESAQAWLESLELIKDGNEIVLVEFTAKRSDFVACNITQNDLVFSKVYLSETEYRKHVSQS
jgi:hypothetical protein